MRLSPSGLLIGLLLMACGGGPAGPPPPPPPPPPAPVPATLTVTAGTGQSAAAGTLLPGQPAVRVRDAGGADLSGVGVQFTVTSGGGWVVNSAVLTGPDGQAAAEWYLGPQPGPGHTLTASVGLLTATITATATAPTPGATIFGRNSYIEYQVGDAPLVLSAPHGGSLTPAEIPDRTVGTTVTDMNTDPLARSVATAFLAETGRRPHLVIARLRRTKLDPNREIVEAAAGNAAAERAWREYHGFLEAARVAATTAGPTPFYVDLHGHGHADQRLEWGYLLSAATLALTDAALNAGPYRDQSSIRGMAAGAGGNFAALLRGPGSLGGRFEAAGYPSVPSPGKPAPGADPYFDGGYSTARHGSRDGGPVSGVQLEMNFTGVRDTEANRLAFAAAAAGILSAWVGLEPAAPGFATGEPGRARPDARATTGSAPGGSAGGARRGRQ